MLEAVGNIPITATIAKAQPIQQSATAPEVSTQEQAGQFAKSRIRVDNFLDRAILELRSKETGEVIQQYPTEQQIKAFDRASELQSKTSFEQGADAATTNDAVSDNGQSSEFTSSVSSAPETSKSAEINVPQATTQTQLSVNVVSSGAGSQSASTTQSIIV